MERELKLSERGAADGEKNIPSSSDTSLTAVEAMVLSRVEGAINQRANEVLGVGSGQDFTTLPQDLEALASEPQTALTQFRAKKARAQNAVGLELKSAQTDFARTYRDYRAFRILHRLTDTEPSYDTVFWRKVFWLAALFVLEVAANGWIIGQASPGGLVQGWTTALMISVLVVLTGSLIGVGPWRYLDYRGADGKGGDMHRMWAMPAIVIGCSLLLLFAFYIAHYRYMLSHSALDAPAPDNILTSVASHPFQPFQQLESLLLFIIAILIGIFSIARGVFWDDPYPGYGSRHRRMEAARERTQDIALGLSQEIDDAKEASDAQLAQIAQKSAELVSALRRAIARTQDNAASWDYTAAQMLVEGRDAITIYRDANGEARSTPPPAYFKADPFADVKPPSSAQVLQQLTSAFSRATANITACKSQIAGARAQLEAEYHSFYDDELTPFLKDIENTAHVHVRTEFSDKITLESDDDAEEEEGDEEEEDEVEEEGPAPAASFFSLRRRR